MALTAEQKALNYARNNEAEIAGMRIGGGETGIRQFAALLRIEDAILANTAVQAEIRDLLKAQASNPRRA